MVNATESLAHSPRATRDSSVAADLMTIGYEGLSTSKFFNTLLTYRVQTVVDVRELPLSRKPGFSKNALAAACSEHGIAYQHMAALGCPKPVRRDYKGDGDWSRYTERYLAYLDSQTLARAQLSDRILRERCCLLCFEADYRACHRSLVSDRIALDADVRIRVFHLGG
jgi:uncharacterized protein (DUF488 family)